MKICGQPESEIEGSAGNWLDMYNLMTNGNMLLYNRVGIMALAKAQSCLSNCPGPDALESSLIGHSANGMEGQTDRQTDTQTGRKELWAATQTGKHRERKRQIAKKDKR